MRIDYTGAEVTYTAPVAGIYTLVGCGAAGAKGNAFSGDYGSVGGMGAKVTMKVQLAAGDVLRVNVGGMGAGCSGTAKDGASGGGGGGTFVFRVIPAITDSRYQFAKGGINLETLLVCAGGGGAWDESYKSAKGDGMNGNGAMPYTPSNFIAWSTTNNAGTASTSISGTMGITQYINYGLKGGFYTRNSATGQGGFGGGSAADDNQGYGGGWYGSNYTAYSWSADTAATGENGANSGNGWVEITEPGGGGTTIEVPDITVATLSPNPVGQNLSFTISVTITEKTVILEPYYYHSGDIYSGEV